MKNFKIKNKINRGYAMVEALTAITILMIVVLAPLTLTYTVEKKSRLASTRAQATYLANEGVENLILYRKSLETYCLANPSTDECALGPAATSSFVMFLNRTICVEGNPSYQVCRFDRSALNSSNVTAGTFTNNSDCTLFYINSNGEYNCTVSATSTVFSRSVTVKPINAYLDRSGSSYNYTGAKITSTVCFDNQVCNNKIDVISYVYQ